LEVNREDVVTGAGRGSQRYKDWDEANGKKQKRFCSFAESITIDSF